MKYFSHYMEDELESLFYQKPQNFYKYSSRELLSYGLGATLYMPATRPHIHQEILSKKHAGLTSLVIDLEDAVGDHQVENAEAALLYELKTLHEEIQKQYISLEDLPIMFIRIRSLEQLQRLKEKLKAAIHVLTGIVIPKFSANDGEQMLAEVSEVSTEKHPFYAMPILESAKVIYQETRMEELLSIKKILDQNRERILNVRIGATDFSGIYGIRRSADMTAYDIAVLRDCIADIMNVFQRADSQYVISGPVWEYFSGKERWLKPQLRQTPFREHFGDKGLKWRAELIDRNMDGLIREVLMDIANGLIGKTIIHPSHIKVVHALHVVSYEEYMDAVDIIESSTGEWGVTKSYFSNKMNEMKPHLYWAQRTIQKSKLFGVLHADYTNIDLLQKEVFISNP
ncbi:HpcH/HpaI aldolase/citrate lyase family protein [Bacillota bacterium Lsc_1132]